MQNHIQNKLDFNIKESIKNKMSDFGFDFSLTGTKYIYELLYEYIVNKECLFEHLKPSMKSLADKYNIKLKTLNRDIRWSIEKNIVIYNKNICLKEEDDISSTKKVIVWLYDFFKSF